MNSTRTRPPPSQEGAAGESGVSPSSSSNHNAQGWGALALTEVGAGVASRVTGGYGYLTLGPTHSLFTLANHTHITIF